MKAIRLNGDTTRNFRVTIVKDRETRQNKGVAFILFLSPDDALRAIDAFNGKEVWLLRDNDEKEFFSNVYSVVIWTNIKM